ncbi:MAG: hypothetical protein O3C05_01470 [Proteobacteria bacterium]|nr:hypothetical protein [Pseudomonadota bacterium]
MLVSHRFNPKIFCKYDIRGLFGITLLARDAYYLGIFLCEWLKNNRTYDEDLIKVVICRDLRSSSNTLRKWLISGLKVQGAHIIDIGISSTPSLYFASCRFQCTGIIITGSHNDTNYNGFKISQPSGLTLSHNQLLEIYEIANKGINITHSNNAVFEEKDIMQSYIKAVLKKNKIFHSKVLWDCGSANRVIRELIKKHINHEIFDEESTLDTLNPRERMAHFQHAVKKFDFGFIFDCDGDRLQVLDRYGNFIKNETLFLLFAKDILIKNKGARIIGDVKISDLAFNLIQEWGGITFISPTGHTIIKQKMRMHNALFAGEGSGHFFFKDNFGFDDGFFAACRFLYIMNSSPSLLHDILSSTSQYIQIKEIRIIIKENVNRNAIVENFIAKTVSALKDSVSYNFTDGIRVKEKNSWWLLRQSHTEPCITINAEAKTHEILTQNLRFIFSILHAIHPLAKQNYFKRLQNLEVASSDLVSLIS